MSDFTKTNLYTLYKTGYLTDYSLSLFPIFVILRLAFYPIHDRQRKEIIMRQKKNITFNDIAKYTHFSKTTISRYFNNPDSLTLENQEIISKALIELDYKENKVARILANGKTEFIGVIVPNLVLHYYSEMLNQILATYETFGYKFLVFIGNGQEETERRYIQELLAYKIEGMIILSHTIPSQELADLQIPIVTIEREDKYVCSVNTDNYTGGYQATDLLASHNCDVIIHINYINSPANPDVPAYGRVQGFTDFCEKYNINHELILKNMGNTYESIKLCLSEILEEIMEKYNGLRKGIFISNDTQANVLVNLLIRKYGHIPDDLFLVGFDNSPISQESVIPISTVGQQIDKLAYEAVSLLVEQMNERKKRKPAPLKEPIHKVIPPVLLKRETTEK